MTRFLFFFSLLGALAGLSACGRGPQTPHHAAIDWLELDSQTPRGGWAYASASLRAPWAGPAETFLPTIAFEAAWDSLGAEAFANRPASERAWRREAAAELVQQAFLAVADRAYRMRSDSAWDPSYAGAMTRVLRRLHTAVGTDPGSTDAWFHLATFSNVVGDGNTAARARHEFLTRTQPHRLEPEDTAQGATLISRRCRLILDEAWDLRDAGRFEACLTWLADHVDELQSVTTGEHTLPPAVESDLLHALSYAELGQYIQARSYQARLPEISLRNAYHKPRITNDLKVWVHAWLDLRTDYLDLASWKMGLRQFGQRPTGLGWRLFQDMGLIASELGDVYLANLFWRLAYRDRPFKLLFPQSAHVPNIQTLGEPGMDLPYYLAYRTFFFGGSLWSYAVTRAHSAQRADPSERPFLWQQAMSALDVCIRRHFQPRAARLLRARLHLQLGDWSAAKADLQAATVAGDGGFYNEADHAFLQGVAALGTGMVARSLSWFERCIELDPEHARAWQAKAVALAYQGRDTEALDAFDKVELLLPRPDGANFFNRGLLYLQRGDRQAALANLERAALLMPSNDRIVTLLQAISTGRDVTVDLTPQPAQFVALATEFDTAAELDRELSHAGLTGQAPSDLELALLAERDRGEATTAAAIAAGKVDDADLDGATLLLAMTILLDHGRVEEARAVLTRAQALMPPDSAVRSLMERMLM